MGWAGSFDAMSQQVTEVVLRHYSTSFSLGTRLFPAPIRRDISNLYAVVRIADEIVDGEARAHGATTAHTRELLDAYETAVLSASRQEFHTDPVLHAFAATARRARFSPDDLRAFFSSMRRDLEPVDFSADELHTYIHGSAEVIGVMCLHIFLSNSADSAVGADKPRIDELRDGAMALGSAFQKINFLRDLHHDQVVLGRYYLPADFNDEAKTRLISGVNEELTLAESAVAKLPARVRTGVAASTALYTELLHRIDALRVDELRAGRIRLSGAAKATVITRGIIRAQRQG